MQSGLTAPPHADPTEKSSPLPHPTLRSSSGPLCTQKASKLLSPPIPPPLLRGAVPLGPERPTFHPGDTEVRRPSWSLPKLSRSWATPPPPAPTLLPPPSQPPAFLPGTAHQEPDFSQLGSELPAGGGHRSCLMLMRSPPEPRAGLCPLHHPPLSLLLRHGCDLESKDPTEPAQLT